MAEDWRVKQHERANAALTRLLERHSECTVERKPVEWLVGTHLVTFGAFAGRRAPFSTWTRFMWYWTGDPATQEPGMRASSVRSLKQILETVRAGAE
jgi:hypothetical protein